MTTLDPFNILQQQEHTPVSMPSAPVQAATPPTGPTGFWNRIGQVGVGQINLLNAAKLARTAGREATALPSEAITTAARALPGGQNDIKAEDQATADRAKDTTTIEKLKSSGKITTPQASKLLANNAKNANENSQNATQTVKEGTTAEQSKQGVSMLTSPITAVGDVGKKIKSQYDYLSGPDNTQRGQPGGMQLIKNQQAAAKNPEYQKALTNVKGKDVGVNATNVAQEMAAKGAKAPEITAYLQKQADAFNANTKRGVGDLVNITSIDASGSKLLDLAKKTIFNKDASTELANNVRTNTLLKAGEEANKPKPITVSGDSSTTPIDVKTPIRPGIKDVSETNQIGVRTPLHPGIKQTSDTYKVGVRAPVKINDEVYSKEFSKLSDSYDKETAALKNLPPAFQKSKQTAIDARYTKSLQDLDSAYHQGVMPKSTTIKKISSETSKAAPATGGAPKIVAKKIASETTVAGKTTGGTARTKLISKSDTEETASKTVTNPTGKPVSTSNLKPVKTTGKTAPSQLSVKVNAKAVENKLSEDLGEAKEHGVMDIKQQAQKATDLINTDEQKATDVALGKSNSPSGLHPHAVFVAVEKKATQDGNVDLLRQLSQSKRVDEATAAGQTLRVLRERDEDSPVAAMQHVSDVRTKAVEKKIGSVPKAVNATAKEIASHEKAPSKFDWQSFVESIKC